MGPGNQYREVGISSGNQALTEVGRGGFGGFFLQGQMHAFMAAVLLRVTRLDAFNADAQPEPSDRKLAQVEQVGGGSERHTVIAANVGRRAALRYSAHFQTQPSRLKAFFHLDSG
jgi:hypothetical protein